MRKPQKLKRAPIVKHEDHPPPIASQVPLRQRLTPPTHTKWDKSHEDDTDSDSDEESKSGGENANIKFTQQQKVTHQLLRSYCAVLCVQSNSRQYHCKQLIPNHVPSSQHEAGILWVFELDREDRIEADPVDENEIDETKNEEKGNNSGDEDETKASIHPTRRLCYVALGQRTLRKFEGPYFLDQFNFENFGFPVLARLPIAEMTGREMYDYVADRFSRYQSPDEEGDEAKSDEVSSAIAERDCRARLPRRFPPL